MKTFNASQLSHDRREILTAARDEGAIIQSKNTNGEVLEEFVMVPKYLIERLIDESVELCKVITDLE
jgi:hypothetical protein